MILEDFIMLGTTIPEPNSDGRIFVCCAGLSTEYDSLIRIYPLARHQCPHRWSVSYVPVQRNNRDNRKESFCLKGNRDPSEHHKINNLFTIVSEKIPRSERNALIERFIVPSIKVANEKRLSLAIIQPKGASRLHFTESKNSPDSPQLALFDDLYDRATVGSARFAYQPRLEFCDGDGWHNLQLRDWGAYEYMRKQGDEHRHELAAAHHLSSNPLLLVGNMNNQRTSWLVISVLFPIIQSDLFASAEVAA
jgi:hypothetical protein